MTNANENISLVSVIMPVYNGEKYLKEAIDSILSQTYTHFEFIIINDGSSDNSEEIILSYTDSRIVYIKNPENFKLIKTLNNGFSLAKGKYIARMDADDISHPERFEKQVLFLDSHSEYGLVGTGVNLVNKDGQKQLLYHTDHASLKFALAFYCPFIHPTVMIRKDVIADMREVFDSKYVHAEDFELWTRLATRTKMANIPEFLLDYRIHDAQISSQHAIHQTQMSTIIRKKYISHYFLEENSDFSYVFKLNITSSSFRLQSQEIIKLYEIDQTNSVFGGENFSRYLIVLWKNLFLEATSIRIKDFAYFVSNSITWKSKWTFRQLISIILKTFK